MVKEILQTEIAYVQALADIIKVSVYAVITAGCVLWGDWGVCLFLQNQLSMFVIISQLPADISLYSASNPPPRIISVQHIIIIDLIIIRGGCHFLLPYSIPLPNSHSSFPILTPPQGYLTPLYSHLLNSGESPNFIKTVFSNIVRIHQTHQ